MKGTPHERGSPMNTENENLITDNLNLARGLAMSFHRTTGLDIEELLSEAMYSLCVAKDN